MNYWVLAQATKIATVIPAVTGDLRGVIVGGIIGIGGGLVTSAFLEHLKQRAERANLTEAIMSEISALLAIVKHRNYVNNIRVFVRKERNINGAPDKPVSYMFSTRRNFFAVYHAILPRIGILKPPLPVQVVEFYVKAAAILEDMDDIREGAIKRDRAGSLDNLEQVANLLEGVISLGERIVGGSRI